MRLERNEVVERSKIKSSFPLYIFTVTHNSYCFAEGLAQHRNYIYLETGRQLSGTSSLTVFKMTHLLLLFRAYFSLRLLKERKLVTYSNDLCGDLK